MTDSDAEYIFGAISENVLFNLINSFKNLGSFQIFAMIRLVNQENIYITIIFCCIIINN